MECWRLDAGIATWMYEALETRCRCSDVDVSKYGALEPGDTLQVLATWRYGGLEASCKCSDVEPWMYRGIDACCKRVDVEG